MYQTVPEAKKSRAVEPFEREQLVKLVMVMNGKALEEKLY